MRIEYLINLPEVTLICIEQRDPLLGMKVLTHCKKEIKFASEFLLSHQEPYGLKTGEIPDFDKNIWYGKIPNTSWEQYNDFVCKELINRVQTEFVLLVQADGFIVNPQLWKPEFLEYDYIGAPWPDDEEWCNRQHPNHQKFYKGNRANCRVGNGGFSLRSKKFLELSSKLPSCVPHGEDYYLCVMNNQYMRDNGVKFPSVELALSFSIENPVKEIGASWNETNHLNFNTRKSFGFHGTILSDYKIL